MNSHLSQLYGPVVYKCLRTAPRNFATACVPLIGFISPSLTWLLQPVDIITKGVRTMMEYAEFIALVRKLPDLTRPPYGRSYSKTLSLIIDHIR
jgi:hypothetical protein